MMNRIRRIGELAIDDVVTAEADAAVVSWLREGGGRVVCTPNADYVVRAGRDVVFRDAINRCDLRVPDGMWIVYASRIAGRPLRGSVTGRLFLPRLAAVCAAEDWSVALLGAAPGVAAIVADRLRAQFPGLRVSAAISPPMGFVVGSAQDAEIAAQLGADPPDLLFVALGAPRQEVWMDHHRATLARTVMIGVGQAFDVYAGVVREAPGWMTRVGLEWVWRLAQQPRRLARRYLVDDPWILWWAVRCRVRGRASAGVEEDGVTAGR
jgi:N-acetylglucosaminyldiphosphoundecaprenol N-acetyl-beta-D-mannosaminyltransferase